MKTNTLYAGDCLDRMREWADDCVNLIYLDPPFNSKANYNILFGKGKDKSRKDDLAQMTAFKDTWQWDADAEERVNKISKAIDHPAHYAIKGFDALFRQSGNGMLAYLSYMAERLAEMRRLLKPTGSIYLHCDPTASHYLKIVMDEIFGRKNFRNEIAWCYKGPANAKHHFPRKHDYVLFYGKSRAAQFHSNAVRVPYSDSFLQRRRHTEGESGITAGYADGRTDKEVENKFGKGKVIEDYWTDIPSGGQVSNKERLGYPTQKPLALLERIIAASSNADDIVLDPFCGCGTTIHAAHNLKRKWMGIDISYYATLLSH
ncbi:DNA methyltransferase [Candidatus Spongiihabitans sp.]|uniref:DNA methyltransferase n=1 Tax=Candidatus Spongiihabitans sp. TaxID=3101308 RepID=UPI003C7C406F